MLLLSLTNLLLSSSCILLTKRDVSNQPREPNKTMGASSPDFRAPPPSPVASSRRASSTANEDFLSEFLDKCGRVPNLVLPEKVFPKHKFLVNPPTFDLGSSSTLMLDAITTIGCFQLINHGIPQAMVRTAMATADKAISHDETEELVLYKDMAACHSDLRELMVEAERIGKAMRDKLGGRSQQGEEEEGVGVCYVKKHSRKNESEGCDHEEDALRMLIRGYDERHCMSLNFCHAEFHVYSKRGWFSFCPRPDALVVTIGDQGWGSTFKSVVGRPLLRHGSLHQHHSISISFLYTTLHTDNNTMGIFHKKIKKTISIPQQLLFALFLTLLFPFFFP